MNKVLILVGVLMMSTGCSGAETIFPKGEFIFSTQGDNNIWGVNTNAAQNIVPIFKLPGMVGDIKHLTKVDKDKIVFSVLTYSLEPEILNESGKEDDREIIEWNRKTGAYRRLREGDNSVYMPKHHKLIFESNRGGLYIADYDSPIVTATLIGQRLGIYLQVIPVSDDEVVMSKYGDRSQFVGNWKYNIVTKELTELSALNECGLTGIWRSKTKQLLCERIVNKRRTGEFYLISLDGKREAVVPLNKNIDMALYIEKYDVLIVGVPRIKYLPIPREAHDMWAYNFDEDKDIRLFKDAWVKVGGVVWSEN